MQAGWPSRPKGTLISSYPELELQAWTTGLALCRLWRFELGPSRLCSNHLTPSESTCVEERGCLYLTDPSFPSMVGRSQHSEVGLAGGADLVPALRSVWVLS